MSPRLLRAFVPYCLAAIMALPAAMAAAQDSPSEPGDVATIAPETESDEKSGIQVAWLPAEVILPEDAEIIADRAVGSTIRMVSIATEQDAEALLAEWREALDTAGYQVEDPAEALADRQVLFSGPGIENGKVVITPTAEDGRHILQFDASLSN